MGQTGKAGRWLGVLALTAAVGCAAMVKRAPGPIKDLPVLIKDPGWVGGDCQSELHSRGVVGLCAVVPLAKNGRPTNPAEITRLALEQGRTQLADTLRQVLLDAVDTCANHCGIPDGPPGLELVARVVKSALEGARVLQTWMAGDDNLYGLVVVDLGAITRAINGNPDLSELAKQELVNRAHEGLR